MMAAMHRGLLYAGMFVNQITPTPPAITGEEVTDVIDAINSTATTFQDFTIGLAALFVIAIFGLAIIAYLYFNRNASKGAQEMMVVFSQAMGNTLKERDERIDMLEDEKAQREEKYNEGIMIVGDGLNKIGDVVSIMQRREAEKDRILSDAVSAMTAIVTVGSKPLQEVVKDVSAVKDTSEEIKNVVSAIYEKFLLAFPSDKSIDMRFDTLKQEMIDAIEQACEKAKHETGEVPTIIEANVHIVPTVDTSTAATDGGESEERIAS